MDKLLCKSDQLTEGVETAPRFSDLYKNSDKLIKRQQQRRNEILSNRLSQRDKLIASVRRLVSDITSDDERVIGADRDAGREEGGALENSNKFEDDSGDSSISISASPPSRKCRSKAMSSEWLVDRPVDFESEWVLKAMPVGRRCLVFSRKGDTVAYSRSGQFIKAFQSSLPGGCHTQQQASSQQSRRQFAIVDGIYVHQTNSFYLLDALAWNEHKLYESEASRRFLWLQSRYSENEEKFLTINSKNESRFYCLGTYSASNQNILTALNNDPLIEGHNLKLDGLLFFHIRGPYVPGANPLVLRAKPEMVNRVLNLKS